MDRHGHDRRSRDSDYRSRYDRDRYYRPSQKEFPRRTTSSMSLEDDYRQGKRRGVDMGPRSSMSLDEDRRHTRERKEHEKPKEETTRKESSIPKCEETVVKETVLYKDEELVQQQFGKWSTGSPEKPQKQKENIVIGTFKPGSWKPIGNDYKTTFPMKSEMEEEASQAPTTSSMSAPGNTQAAMSAAGDDSRPLRSILKYKSNDTPPQAPPPVVSKMVLAQEQGRLAELQRTLERERELEREIERQQEQEQKLKREIERQQEQERELERQRERELELERRERQMEAARQRERQIELERQRERERELDRQRELERQRERELERQRERELERQRERELERQREIEKQREQDRELERQRTRDREREILRQRELERQRERDRERERERTPSDLGIYSDKELHGKKGDSRYRKMLMEPAKPAKVSSMDMDEEDKFLYGEDEGKDNMSAPSPVSSASGSVALRLMTSPRRDRFQRSPSPDRKRRRNASPDDYFRNRSPEHSTAYKQERPSLSPSPSASGHRRSLQSRSKSPSVPTSLPSRDSIMYHEKKPQPEPPERRNPREDFAHLELDRESRFLLEELEKERHLRAKLSPKRYEDPDVRERTVTVKPFRKEPTPVPPKESPPTVTTPKEVPPWEKKRIERESSKLDPTEALSIRDSPQNKPEGEDPEPEEKRDPHDPTIENILKSIGFNFELSKLMQEKANKERSQKQNETEEFGIKESASFMDSGILTGGEKAKKPEEKVEESYAARAKRYLQEHAMAKALGRESPTPFSGTEKRQREERSSETRRVEVDSNRRGHDGSSRHHGSSSDRRRRSRSRSTGRHRRSRSRSLSPDHRSSKRSDRHRRHRSRSRHRSRDRSYSRSRSRSPYHKRSPSSSHSRSRSPTKEARPPSPAKAPVASEGTYQTNNYYAAVAPAVDAQYGVPYHGQFPGDPTAGYRMPPPGPPQHPTVGQPPPPMYGHYPPPFGPYGNIPSGDFSIPPPNIPPPPVAAGLDYPPTLGDPGVPPPVRSSNLRVLTSGDDASPVKDTPTQAPVRPGSNRTVIPPKSDVVRTVREKLTKEEPTEKRTVTLKKPEAVTKPSPKMTPVLSASERATLLRQSAERKQRLAALEKELDRLRRQQNELMRKRQRQRDGHKDPLLLENSKLQEEISAQISALRKAVDENASLLGGSEMLSREQRGSSETKVNSEKTEVKTETKFVEEKAKKQDVPTNNKNATEEEAKPEIIFEYFDPGNHWCRLCNFMASNVYTLFEHLQSRRHESKLDPYNRPWMSDQSEEAVKKNHAGQVRAAPLQGSEFLRATQAFYCSLCKEFSGDPACAEQHLKSMKHNKKYKDYCAENPFYERRYNLDKAAGVSLFNKAYRSEKSPDVEIIPASPPKKQQSDSKRSSQERGSSSRYDKNKSSDDKDKNRKDSYSSSNRSSRSSSSSSSSRKPEIKEPEKPSRESEDKSRSERNQEAERKNQQLIRKEKESSKDVIELDADSETNKVPSVPMVGKRLAVGFKTTNKTTNKGGPEGPGSQAEEEKTESGRKGICIKLSGIKMPAAPKVAQNPLQALQKKESRPLIVPQRAPSFLNQQQQQQQRQQQQQQAAARPIPTVTKVHQRPHEPASLDMFLSIDEGNKAKSLPVYVSEKDMQDTKVVDQLKPEVRAKLEEMKMLGILPDTPISNAPVARPPPQLPSSGIKPSSNMATTEASKMYGIFFGGKDKGQGKQPNNSSDSANKADAESDASEVEMDMGDFDILDECGDE